MPFGTSMLMAAGQLRNKVGAGMTIEDLPATPSVARGFDQADGPAHRTAAKRQQRKGAQRERTQWMDRSDLDRIPNRPYSDQAAQRVFEERVARKHDFLLQMDGCQSRIRYSRIMMRAR